MNSECVRAAVRRCTGQSSQGKLRHGINGAVVISRVLITYDSLDRAPIELVGVATASRCCHRAGTEPPLRESDATVKLTIPVKC